MLGKDLSEALGDISDEMVEAAAGTGEGKKRGSVLWLRIAAAVATLAILLTAALWPRKTEDGYITAPGVLKVYAYDLESTGATEELPFQTCELKEGVEMPYEFGWSIATNVVPGLPIKLSMPTEGYADAMITFSVRVTGGECFRRPSPEYGAYRFGPAYLGRDFVLENDQTIYWWNMITDLENWEEEYDEDRIKAELEASTRGETTGYQLPTMIPFYHGKAYVDAIVYADEHIIGCVRILIYAEDQSYPVGSPEYGGCRYYAKLISSVSYPKVNGRYQDISVEHVEELMKQWK